MGPGEYEVKGAMIDGVSLENGNTAFSIMVDDIRLAHLGDLQQETLVIANCRQLELLMCCFYRLMAARQK